MGRTIPSFRIAEAEEFSEWKPFRKALPKSDRKVFDAMLNSARLYTSASSAAVRASRFEGMAMAIIFHHQRLLTRCVGAFLEGEAGQGPAPQASFEPTRRLSGALPASRGNQEGRLRRTQGGSRQGESP